MAVARTLHIQVQPEIVESLDVVRLRKEFLDLANNNPLVIGHRFRNGNDNGDYYNFDFDTDQPAAFWNQVLTQVFASSDFGGEVRKSSMAICTGRNGWDDYLLIHHWDPAEELDEVPAI